MDHILEKKAMRKLILTSRKNLPPQEVYAKSKCISQLVISHPHFVGAQRILIYLDFRNEVITETLIEYALAEGKEVYVPVVIKDDPNLALVRYIGPHTPMTLSDFGIQEPLITAENTTNFETLDLVLAPGVAFDAQCFRLGYGGGYYDRLLAHSHADEIPIYALAFSLQIVPKVPHEHWDKPMHGVFTEDGFISAP